MFVIQTVAVWPLGGVSVCLCVADQFPIPETLGHFLVNCHMLRLDFEYSFTVPQIQL